MTRRCTLSLLVACCVLSVGTPAVRAVVNEALSFARKAAAPYVKDGFSVREDHWQGKMTPGKKKAIKHQLYKGNEYWFWLGSPAPGIKISVKIYDSKGRPVDVETKIGNRTASARVLAPKTGTYYIVIEAMAVEAEKKSEKKKKDPVGWGLVYGFR